ncbi:MAG: hypothetical protein ACRDRR_21950 [Pseudonocardiaceae bacterium]
MTEQLQTSPITVAELDGACQRFVFIPGHLDVGATVRCPGGGDHEHRILTACHTAVVENIVIIEN